MMDSEEAIMENENNSNLESESGIRERVLNPTVEEISMDVSPDVTGGPSNISTSLASAGVCRSESAAEIESPLNEALDSTSASRKREFTIKNGDEWKEVFALDEPVESATESAVADGKEKGIQEYEDFIGADSLQNNGNTQSRASENVGKRSVDGAVNERQSYMEPSPPGSHDDDDVILCHTDISSESQSVRNVQQMDVGESSEPTFQPSERNNEMVEVNANTVVESKNSEKTAPANTHAINQPVCSNVTGASKYWDDDIDLLGDDSQDCIIQTDNIEEFGILTDNRVVSVLMGEKLTYKAEKPETSYSTKKTVNDVTGAVFGDQRSLGTATSITLSKSGNLDDIAQENIDKMLKEEVNISKGFSTNLLAQPQSRMHGCKKNVEIVKDALHVEAGTSVEKKSEALAFSNKTLSGTNDIPKLSVHDNVNENVGGAVTNVDVAMGVGDQELKHDYLYEAVDRAIVNTKEKLLLQEINALEDVATNVTAPNCVSEGAFKISSLNRTVFKNISFSELTKQTDDASVDTVNKNHIKIEEVGETNASLDVELLSADIPQSCAKSNTDLVLEDSGSSEGVLELMEAGRDEDNTPAETEICKSAEATVLGKSASNQSFANSTEFTTKSGLEISTAETAYTSHVFKETVDSCQKVPEKNNDSLRNDTSLTGNVGTTNDITEGSEDLMESSEIKREQGSSYVTTFAGESLVHKNEPASVEIKQELNAEKADDSDEDVMVVDDEGQIIPLKKEILELKIAENGLDTHVSTVTGEQQYPRADPATASELSSDAGNKIDSQRSKSTKSKLQTCIVCQKTCRCKYNIVRNGDVKHLCEDVCFKHFRKSPSAFLKAKDDLETLNASSNITQSTLPSKDAQASSPMEMRSRQVNPCKTCAVCQLVDVNTLQPFCNWKGLDFCGESCLGKFQANLNTSCSYCHVYIPIDIRTTFCLKIGNDMRPFCKLRCYTEFKKKLRLCSFCQRDVAAFPQTFTAMVGTDGKFKEFCSQDCMKKLESQINHVEVLSVDEGNLALETIICSVCKKQGPMKYTARLQEEENKLCSDLCLSAFQYTNKINMGKCDSCGTTCTIEEAQAHYVQYEGKVKRFCSDICVSSFCKTNSKVVPCGWCAIKKLNFDMIERLDVENRFQKFCSLTCLSLFRVNLQAKSNQAVPCDQCQKVVPAQYHLTMSDASVLNFCSYACVMTFQTQFATKHASAGLGPTTSVPLATPTQTQQQGTPLQQTPTVPGDGKGRTATQQGTPLQQTPTVPGDGKGRTATQQQGTPLLQTPTLPGDGKGRTTTQQLGTPLQQTPTLPGDTKGRMTTRQVSAQQHSSAFPVISNVVSLAPQGGDSQIQSLQTPPSAPAHMVTSLNAATGTVNSATGMTGNMLPSGDGKHQIIIQAAPPKYGKNKSLQCRPITQTKATSCRPHSQSKEVQTDEVPIKTLIIPVPVPIYIPMPTVMFSAPAPRLVPIPIPIPVPIFLPTTRKSIIGICKTIQEIVERIPADPLEAELLMMAEAVAADKGPENMNDTDTDNEADVEGFDDYVKNEVMKPAPEDDDSSATRKRGEHGDEEDMLRMALRMAEEMSGPIEDLEASVAPVAVSSEPPDQKPKVPAPSYDSQDDVDYVPPLSLRGRGVKRSRGRPPLIRPKRQRLEKYTSDDDSMLSESSVQPNSVEHPLDFNYRLKFTFGVNAWRHWVISKNVQMEKSKPGSNIRARAFPTDILKCTVDELNTTLCMFIDEVRKPSGAEYSPDSIFYLCLGLQQHLYENGRIDNIFADSYFEKFTNRMHEIVKSLQPKVDAHGQMLCRIEEEHLWESKQLGAHSPFVLLNTLIYFHTKHFILKTVSEHMSLSFAQILKHWRKGMPAKGQTVSTAKNVSLRFYCLTNGKKDNCVAKKSKEGVPVYEVTENLDNPLRCPVKLYEFFLSKCPESIKNRNDIFYPVPERSCVPDSPVWYSTLSIDSHTMDKMLTRILLVREIQEAHLHAQPIYL